MRLRSVRGSALAALLLAGLTACGGDDDPDPMEPEPEPPSAPTGVAVESVGDATATVSWDPVDGAASYTLYGAAETGVTPDNYASLDEGARIQGATSPQEVTGLAPGEAYYFVVTASNDDGESDPSAEVSATTDAVLSPSEDLVLDAGEYTFTAMDIPEGVTVTVDGPVTIEVEGDAEIGGTIVADCEAMEIRVTGDLTLAGLLSNLCGTELDGDGPELRLVADGEIVLGSEGASEPVITSDGLVHVSDSATEDEELEPVAVADVAPAEVRGPSGPARQAGPGTATIFGPMEGDRIRISIDQALRVDADLTTHAGKDAPAENGSPICDSSGTSGEDAGDIYLFSRTGTLTVGQGVTLTAGDGGAGPDCTATGDPDAESIAGDGGRGGGVYLGGQNLTFEAGVTLIRGNGGVGGRARAEGAHAPEDSCLDGGTATANGGQGGRAGGAGYIAGAEPVIQGQPEEGGGDGGVGGEGSARGGDGGNCVCGVEDGNGGDGGDATASGGRGGDGATGSLFAIVADTHRKGMGGFAEALGGFGGDGADCCDEGLPGGDGGDGGDATATGGAQGELGMNDSEQGEASTFGGDAGDGGDGTPPGGGGAGGAVTTEGSEIDETPGENGVDGEPCPADTALLGVDLNVLEDPDGHEEFTALAATVDELEITIDNGAVTIEGNGNWVVVVGDIDEEGNVTALGSGTAAGFPNTSFSFTGTVERDESGTPVAITGTLVVGGNGALPGGMPVTYGVASN